MTADPKPSAAEALTPAAAPASTDGSAVSDRIDQFVQWLKWPSAVVALVFTPLLLWALGRMIGKIVLAPSFSLVPFVAGIIGFAFLWRRWLGKSRWGAFLITLEHESTHALFALLTWHAIVGFRASLGQGGEVRFAGKGNWLITASPYFFPTAAIILFLLAFFLPFAALPWQSFLLGVALAYHVTSTYRETHRDQSDLKILGKLFCWSFLPAANIAVIGLLLSFSYAGNEGVQVWLGFARDLWDATLKSVWAN